MRDCAVRFIFHLRHAIILAVIFFALYHQFLSLKYADYPWWHPLSNDMDSTHAATTVGLLNDSDYTLVYHPAATLLHIHGLVYRAAAIHPQHQSLLRLSSVNDMNEAVEILSQATRLSRLGVFATMLAFTLVLYSVLFQLTHKSWLAGLLSFYVVSSGALARHMVAIRAEIWALVSFLLAVLVAVYFSRKPAKSLAPWIGRFVLMGWMLTFAIFTKIQIVPAIIFYCSVLGVYLFCYCSASPFQRKHLLIWTGGSVAIFPWWAFFRPEFLTQEYFTHLSKYSDLWKVYGSAPANFVNWPIVFYTLLFFWILSRPRDGRIQSATIGLVLGFSLAVYLILLPVSGSIAHYITNTQHLVYAVLTNMTHGGYVTHRVLDHTTFEKILQMYATDSALGRIQLIWVVGIISFFCGIRLFLKSSVGKMSYALVLIFFALAVVMDILATMRFYELFYYYGLFSLTFYAIGIALWISLELKGWSAQRFGDFKNVFWIISVACVIIISFHALKRWQELMRLPPGEVKLTITPEREYRDVRTHAKPFWNIVHTAIEKNAARP